MAEDRYEAFEIIIRARTDDQSWFDIFVDQVTETCQGTVEEGGCTCGMESAGGMSGTLEECYKWTGIDDDKVTVNKADLLVILQEVRAYLDIDHLNIKESFERLDHECNWWDEFIASIEDDDDDWELE